MKKPEKMIFLSDIQGIASKSIAKIEAYLH